MKRPAAALIFFAVQHHRNGGLKRLAAHGINAGLSSEYSCQLVLGVLDLVDRFAFLWIDGWLRGMKHVPGVPVIPHERNLLTVCQFEVPSGFVAHW